MLRIRLAAITVLILVLAAVSACGSSSEQSSDEPQLDPNSSGGEASQTTLEQQETPPAEDSTPEDPGASAEAGPVEVQTSVLATNLEAPWAVAFLPDGNSLVTERDSGRVLSVSPSGETEEVQTLPADGSGEGGLLGLALSPDYEIDGLVYAYYTTAEDNRVVRFRLGEEPEPILTGIPVNTYHNGGRISFGPDDLLYVGTGDAGNTASSQDPNALGGKILRINPDGSVPADNPFPDNPVYSYGHRNVQGLAWDAEGRLYATEFGQNTYDEVNLIEPGQNYGWPNVEGDGGEAQGYVDPISTWATSEASPSGAAVLTAGGIPQWQGDFFMAALRGERLWRLDLDQNGAVVGREELLTGQAGRLRHVAQAPDGSLWILTNNRDGRGSPIPDDDRILRLAPAEG
jgi:glucose/arabinose dehydrogenase